ncbi:MAG: GreA/GreB family elongation factor [Patescibacteria group bacterium]
MKRIPFTRDGYQKLQQEKSDLEKQRVEAVINLKTARDMGDLSENAAYKVARSKLSSVDRRLRTVNAVISRAYVIKPLSQDTVEVGSVVYVENNMGRRKFQIVNSHESDVLSGKISYYSPIGQALVGKKVGSKINVKIPSGVVEYTIAKISTD